MKTRSFSLYQQGLAWKGTLFSQIEDHANNVLKNEWNLGLSVLHFFVPNTKYNKIFNRDYLTITHHSRCINSHSVLENTFIIK